MNKKKIVPFNSFELAILIQIARGFSFDELPDKLRNRMSEDALETAEVIHFIKMSKPFTTRKDIKNTAKQIIEEHGEAKLSREQNKELRELSGEVNSFDPLVSFLYLLMRDHLPIGEVESILRESITEDNLEWQLTNGYLAKYAKDVANRLKPSEIEDKDQEDPKDYRYAVVLPLSAGSGGTYGNEVIKDNLTLEQALKVRMSDEDFDWAYDGDGFPYKIYRMGSMNKNGVWSDPLYVYNLELERYVETKK